MAIGDTSNNLKPLVPMLPFPMPQEGAPPLPPFSPGEAVNTADLMAQLESLLQPSAPTPQPTGFGGVLSRLLNALPQAVAVGLSKDPALALGEHLKEVQRMNFQREQQAQARKDRLEDFRRQVGVDVVREQIADRRMTARERRAYEQQVRITGQEQAFRTGERQAEAESRFRLAEYDNQARTRMQENANAFQLKLVDLANQRDDMAKYTTQREKHRAMGIPPNIADAMANADVKGLPYDAKAQAYVDAWTASEKKFRDTGRNLELAKLRSEIQENLAQASAARAAAAASSAKSIDFGWVDKESWGMTQDGRLVILDKMAKSPTGEHIDEKGQMITPLDQRQARAVYMMREAQGLMSGSKGAGAQVTGAEKKLQADHWDAIINMEKKAKVSDEAIKAKLLTTAKAKPEDAPHIQDALIRNGLEKDTTGRGRKLTTIGGSSVPIPDFGPLSASPASGIPQVGAMFSSGLEALKGMFQKNTPEQNLQLLEQMRSRGAFGKEKPTPTPAGKSGPKPLGVLPPFDPNKIGSIGRGIEALGNVTVEPTGDPAVDNLLRQLGLLAPQKK